MATININADLNLKGEKLPHMWSKCVGAGRACEGLRAEWQRQLKIAARECGFEYIRFHGLLAEDMFVCEERDGEILYNWQYIDALYDYLVEIGVKPFVEFGFMPPALASGANTQFWWKGNITPPKDYKKWGDLIKALVTHWADRYGMEVILTWYYEIWNEADLKGFWHGTKSEYFELYRVSVLAIKEVNVNLRVGGPATSNFVPDGRFDTEIEDITKHITHTVEDLNSLEWRGVWIEDFLKYCEKYKLPVDFVSTHPYPTDFALDGQQNMKGRSRCVDSLKDDMQWLQKIVRTSAYPNAEIHLTEWSSSPTSRDYSHDYLPAANYIVKCNLDCAGMSNSLSYWVFTDIFEEAGGGPESFHGGFGLINMQGIKKPTYHAYRLLHQLGTDIIQQGENYIITKTAEGKLRALFYNYAKELKESVPISSYPDYKTAEQIQEMGNAEEIHLVVEGIADNCEIKMEYLNISNAVSTKWAQMGYPRNLTKQQEKELKKTLPLKQDVSHANGTLDIRFLLDKWCLVLLYQ